MKKPELLAPAGNLDILKIAFLYGADAVYCGTPDFAMRARVGFDLISLKEGIEYAHSIGKKVYVTLNAFPHSTQIDPLIKHIPKLIALKPDALIIADPGILHYIHDKYPKMPIHLSTQANTTNYLAAEFWRKQGAERIVLARELSLSDVNLIRDNSKISIECFVHGAMCMAYSGRCQISNYLTKRDPNKGQCIQACRFKYKIYGLEEEFRPGEIFPIYEDAEGSHILNSKDLCMIDHIPEMIAAGITSFKIEGRLKTEYYVATTIQAYRTAIDELFNDKSVYQKNRRKYKNEVMKASNREFTTGFYFEKPNLNTNNYKSSRAVSTWGYIGRVIGFNDDKKRLILEAKNHLPINATLEIITPSGNIKTIARSLYKNDEKVDVAHAGNIVEIPYKKATLIPLNSLIRIRL